MRYFNMTPKPLRFFDCDDEPAGLIMPSGLTVGVRNRLRTADHRLNFLGGLSFSKPTRIVTTHPRFLEITGTPAIPLYQSNDNSSTREIVLTENDENRIVSRYPPARDYRTLYIVTPDVLEFMPADRDDFCTPDMPIYDNNNNLMGYRGLRVRG